MRNMPSRAQEASWLLLLDLGKHTHYSPPLIPATPGTPEGSRRQEPAPTEGVGDVLSLPIGAEPPLGSNRGRRDVQREGPFDCRWHVPHHRPAGGATWPPSPKQRIVNLFLQANEVLILTADQRFFFWRGSAALLPGNGALQKEE